MGRNGNVNVDVITSFRGNVNVRKARILNEDRLVVYIKSKLGAEADKDDAWWHKVAKELSEDQIVTGLEIAEKKKPFGMQRIRYVSGIYSNMMHSRLA